MLQITRSCRFMSLALIAFKGQACSETYEYRNTFSSCRHLSTSIDNRLKAIIPGKPFSFNFLVSSFLRILFMRLYFRIIFFTSHYCLCSFIISYLSYLVFLSCSSYFPKLKVGSMRWHHLSISSRRDVTQVPSATIRIQPRPSLQAHREHDEFHHFGPLDLVGRYSDSWFLPWPWFQPKCWHQTRFTPHSPDKKLSCFLLKEWEATTLRWHVWYRQLPGAQLSFGWSGRDFVFKLHR